MEESKKYPRTYSLDARTRRAFIAIGVAPLALVIAVAILKMTGVVSNTLSSIALLSAGLVAGLYGLIISGSVHRRVILYEDGITVWSWFSSRRLSRSEILGKRMGKLAWQVVPVDRSAKELRLPPFLHVMNP
jgi:hypothetical protein